MVDSISINDSNQANKAGVVNNRLKVTSLVTNNLIPDEYDYISLSYTGDDLTGVVYKTGGAGGTTVATLTLTYTASVLQTVTRT